MEKKEKNIINMVLTCAILLLAVSIALYLFSLRPRNQKDGQDSGPSGDETVSAATLAAASGSPAEETLPPVETRLVDLGNYVTFIPFGVVSDSDNNTRTVLGNYVTVRPVGSNGDPEEVLQQYKKAADRGDATAQYVVYAFEYAGIGGASSDPNEMMTYLCTSAENGYAPAQNELALSYAANKNYDDAATWFEKAAGQEFPAAQNNLGILYHNGYGVPIDFRKAYDCFSAAAEQGIPEAQFNLGFLYENGFGAEQDSQRAFEQYLQAAKAGYCQAQTFVGDAYRTGSGTDMDPKEAFYWYSLAAEQGDHGAEYWLGYMYDNGIGVEQNAEYAGMWYSRAAEASREMNQRFSEKDAAAKAQLSPEEQLSLYRQFLLRGDLMRGCGLDASQLRYRLYDIDEDGTPEVFFATPNGNMLAIGKLWLDKNNQVNQTASYVSNGRYSLAQDKSMSDVDPNAMIGTVLMNGKRLEAQFFGRECQDWWIKAWLLYDPSADKNADYPQILSMSEAYSHRDYAVYGDSEYQIPEEEFPRFYQQVDMIIGTGSMFDPYAQTVSYEELIGSETLSSKYTGSADYMVIIDWKQSTQFPSDRKLSLLPTDLNLNNRPDLNAPCTLPVADNAVIHVSGHPMDDFATSYLEDLVSIDEYIENYNTVQHGWNDRFFSIAIDQGNTYVRGYRQAYIQVQNGEIITMWMNPEQWG